MQSTMLGQTVSHFEILDKIGEGGMGVVYRARDLRLDRSVALKFLPRHLSKNEEEKRRFIHEAKAASALDHPNICTIHEVDEVEDGQVFIAMAAYEGETVKSMIRDGPLPLEKVIDLGLQMASGLAAAHERGIVHRDVKPANFMVTRDGVVKILDFGLSKFTAGVSGQSRPAGALVGTVAYMSPEQVQGEVVTHQTDIWALGVVLFEMATGSRPFQGDTELSVLFRIAHRDPEPLPETLGEIPPELRWILRKALAKETKDRYRTVEELRADLESLLGEPPSTGLTSTTWSSRSWRRGAWADSSRRRRGLVAAVAAVVLLVAAGGWWWRSESASRTAGAMAESPRRVALVGFESRAGDDVEGGWLGSALGDLLTLELSASAGLVWLPSPDGSDEAPESLVWGPQGFNAAGLERLRHERGAGWVVAGSYRLLDTGDEAGSFGDSEIEVELWAGSTEPGRRRQPIAGRGVLPELASQLAPALARALETRWGVPRGTRPAMAEEADPEAVERLREARSALRRLDAFAARSAARAGLESDPGEPWLHAAAADAANLLGFEKEARHHAVEAFELAAGRPLGERAALLARRLEAERELERSAALRRALWGRTPVAGDGVPGAAPSDLGPSWLDRGLLLAVALASSGQDEAAESVLETLRGAEGETPHLALAEAEVARQRADYRAQREAARRAASGSDGDQARFLRARALYLEGEALRRLTDYAEAEAALESARAIYAEAGHVRGEADTLITLGNVAWDRQDLAAAKGRYEEAVRLYASIGSDRLRSRALFNQGVILYQRGDYEAALAVYQQQRELLRDAGDRVAEAIMLVNVGEILFLLGRFDDSESVFGEALEIAAEIDNPLVDHYARFVFGEFLILRGELGVAARNLREAIDIQQAAGDRQSSAETLFLLARVHHHQGDLAEALRLDREARKVFEESGNRSASYARVRRGQGETFLAMGQLEEASAAFEEALSIQDELGNPRAAETRLSLAELALEGGRGRRAEALVREALMSLEASGEVLEASKGHRLLAQLRLDAGDLEAAAAEIETARELLGDLDSPLYRLPLELVAARLAAVRGDTAAARESLQASLAAATTGGFLEQQLEIRLCLGEFEISSGSVRAGRSRLERLEEEARQKGFHLLAQKARRAIAIEIKRN